MTITAGVRHLRAQGAYLYKRTSGQHLSLYEAKSNVAEHSDDRITEAFEHENWPHLVHALEEGDDVLKKRVLKAMTEVFKLPKDLAMCLQHGVLDLIDSGILSENSEIQQLSAQVLSVIAASSNGRTAIAEGETVQRVLPVFAAAAHLRTCSYLYDAFIAFTQQSFLNAQCLTKANYLAVVLSHLKRNMPSELTLRSLKLLKYLVNDGIEATGYRAIELNGVQLCGEQLASSTTTVRVAACDALGALGCIEKAKKVAVEAGVVKQLCAVLTEKEWRVAAASAGALMVIAIHDEAKRAIVAAQGLQPLAQLLQMPQLLTQLNTVKLITVMAAYPPARRILNVTAIEYHLKSLTQDKDPLLMKSARLALQAVQWDP